VTTNLDGLSSNETQSRLREFGPNAVPEARARAFTVFLRKLSGPVPWMLEAALVLELVLGKHIEACILGALLLINAGVSFSHERRARGALDLLRKQLQVLARVRREGSWMMLPSEGLVPGDIVHVRAGDFVPADLRVAQGEVLLDQSALTGESAPVEAGLSVVAPTGAVVRRGEATGEVIATGLRTVFGKTVRLVQEAQSKSHLEALVLTMVKTFVALDGVLALTVLVVAVSHGERLTVIVPFVLMLLIASVPVALPATFTLATAVGAGELARRGVLVTRLAALEELAALDVLCADKTGTLTENKLSFDAVEAVGGFSDAEVVQLAALASDSATQDPIDLAILDAAQKGSPLDATRVRLIPFDPETKRSEAIVRRGNEDWHVIKGAPLVVARLSSQEGECGQQIQELAARGCRVLAVAAGPAGACRLAGFIGLLDLPREDSKEVVEHLQALGVRVIMVTGDSEATAAAVAIRTGIGTRVATKPDADPSSYDALAGVLPEDKFSLVRSLQQAGHIVGMTGDGVNDAPALKQADVGIAVASAIDAAKSAASLVLTAPGLGGALAAIDVGRRIYQRMLTYTLNMSVKKLEIPVFLAIGFLAFKTYVVTPRLVLLLMLTNDLSTMTLASDHVRPSPHPDQWKGRSVVLSAIAMAIPWLMFAVGAFEVGRRLGHLSLPETQTLAFLTLVFMGQANVYLARERRHLWSSVPGKWTLIATGTTVLTVSTLATLGLLMAPLRPLVVLSLLGPVIVFALVLDMIKVRLLSAKRDRASDQPTLPCLRSDPARENG
jgi:H+-transporting ATPase